MNDTGDCITCGQPGTLRTELPLSTIACDRCMAAAKQDPDPLSIEETRREFESFLARRDGEDGERPDTRAAAGVACRECGAPAQWFRQVNGRPLLMERGAFPITEIPANKRWQVTHGDTVAIVRAVPEDGHCRVCHFDVCPGRGEAPESARLRQLWKANDARRAGG